MTMLYSDPTALTTPAIIDLLGQFQRELRDYREAVDRLQFELIRRMEQDNQTLVPHPRYEVTLSPGAPSLDLSRVRPLLEDETLIAYGLEKVYTPAHEEVVAIPEKWSLQNLQVAARKLGGQVAQLVGLATMRAQGKLTVREKRE